MIKAEMLPVAAVGLPRRLIGRRELHVRCTTRQFVFANGRAWHIGIYNSEDLKCKKAPSHWDGACLLLCQTISSIFSRSYGVF